MCEISADMAKVAGPRIEPIAIYYTTIDSALTVTLSEKVLDRAMDRALAADRGLSLFPLARLDLGLRVDHRILEVVNALSRQQYEQTMQTHCWNNLPILNEWKRLYPERDPVEVHQQVWGVELICPGGGKYVWNEKFATMESSVYGHPGEPRKGPPAPPVLSSFTSGNFGLTLEHEGRAPVRRWDAEPNDLRGGSWGLGLRAWVFGLCESPAQNPKPKTQNRRPKTRTPIINHEAESHHAHYPNPSFRPP